MTVLLPILDEPGNVVGMVGSNIDSVADPKPFTFLDTLKDGNQSYRASISFYVGTSKVAWNISLSFF